MSPILISLIVLACVFASALAGTMLHGILPEHHLTPDSRDIVKLGVGLIGTMAALVLGLLVAAAKNAYDAQSAEVTQVSANIAAIDRMLANYGPETREIRQVLRDSAARILDDLWPQSGNTARPALPVSAAGEVLYNRIQSLAPRNDTQRSLQAQALSVVTDTARTRWLMYAQSTDSVSMPLLIVLVLWLAVIFTSFGLFAPLNATVLASLFVSALSVSAAIFLILEMYTPYTGVMQISNAPLHAALAQLGQ